MVEAARGGRDIRLTLARDPLFASRSGPFNIFDAVIVSRLQAGGQCRRVSLILKILW